MAAPPPPPPPLGSDEQEQEREPVEEPEDVVPVETIPQEIPQVKKHSAIGSPFGHVKGVPGGEKGGIPGSPLTGLQTTGLKLHTGIAQRRPDVTPPPLEPIAAVRARCIYCPDPDQRKLASTSNGMFNRRNGRNQTQFCVDTKGSVSSVKTVQKFPGDPGVDGICRQTVKKWRFKPQRIAGRARETCSTVTFDLQFK